MIEIIKIILQIVFISVIFIYSFTEIKKYNFINNLHFFEKMSINVILFLNLCLIFSLFNLNDILLITILFLVSIFVFTQKINKYLIGNFKFHLLFVLFFFDYFSYIH